MRINIAGKYEEWNKEKLEGALKQARAFHENQMGKDIDDAWLSQWAADTLLTQLHLIGEILEDPIMEYVWGITCPECGTECRKLDGRYGAFYRCRNCGWRAGAYTAKVTKLLKTGQSREIRRQTNKAIGFNDLGIPYITRDDRASPSPTMSELLGIR